MLQCWPHQTVISQPYRGRVDASDFSFGGTVTQLDDTEKDRVIVFSKNLSTAEQKCTANDRYLLGLVHFLQRSRCYLEGTSFDTLTENQFLKHFFTNLTLSRRAAGEFRQLWYVCDKFKASKD